VVEAWVVDRVIIVSNLQCVTPVCGKNHSLQFFSAPRSALLPPQGETTNYFLLYKKNIIITTTSDNYAAKN
jgi:hypothetical protein